MSKQTVLAVDWDGVIHNRDSAVKPNVFGEPYPDAQQYMKKLQRMGYRLVVHTCVAHTPAGYTAVVEWLKYHRVPYHEVTAVKPVASLYIDDNAHHHTDWVTTLEAIKTRARR